MAGNLEIKNANGKTVTLQNPDTNNSDIIIDGSQIVTKSGSVTDNSVPRFDGTTGKVQNSSVTIDDNGNVGIGGVTPKARLDVYTLGIYGGLPTTTGHAADPNVMARLSGNSVCMDFGAESVGHQWIQCRNLVDYSLKYDLHLQPNGGNVLVTGTGALGYGTGAGGTVTQLISKSNAVTLNKPCGVITMNNAALAAGTTVSFYFNNSLISITDQLVITLASGAYSGSAYDAWAYTVDGIGEIYVKNTSGTSFSEPVVLRFSIIKGANS